jgi:hypothetical protein
MFESLIDDSKRFLHKSALKVVQIPASLSEILAEKKVPFSIYLTLSSYFYAFQQVKSYVPSEIFTETYENIIDHVAEFIKKSKTPGNSELNDRLKELGTAHQIFAEYLQNKRVTVGLATALLVKFLEVLTNAWNLLMYIPVSIMLVFGLSTLFQGLTAAMRGNSYIETANTYAGIGFGPLFWGTLSIGGAIAVGALLSLVWRQKLLLLRMTFSAGATILFVAVIGGGMLCTDWISHDIDSAKFETSNTYMIAKGQSKTLILGSTSVAGTLQVNIIEDDYSKQLGNNVVTVQSSTEIYQNTSWLETGIKPSVVYYQEDSMYKNRPATILKSISNIAINSANGVNSGEDSTTITIFLPKGEYTIALNSVLTTEAKSALGITANENVREREFPPTFTVLNPKFETKRLTVDNNIAIHQVCDFDYDLQQEQCVDSGFTGQGNVVLTITKL